MASCSRGQWGPCEPLPSDGGCASDGGGDAASRDAAADDELTCGTDTQGPYHTTFASGLPTWASALASNGATGQVVDGGFVARPAARTTESRASVYTPAVSFHDRRVFGRISRTLEPVEGAETYFGIGRFGESWALLAASAGMIGALVNDAGEVYMGSQRPLRADDVWWQLREERGRLHFETSPDARSWTVVDSVPTPSFADTVGIGGGAGTSVDTVDSPGSARLEAVGDCLLE